MESLNDVLDMVRPGVWMASVDLKDAYYSIPIHKDDQKFFTFSWEHNHYKFVCMPNGYAQAPMIFTKIMKCPFSYLRSKSHQSVIYLDDAYMQGYTYASCYSNICCTTHLLTQLGFFINTDKSVLSPTQQ